MEKNFITLEIQRLKWVCEAVEIDRAISDLQEAKAKGATHIQVEAWTEYDCAIVEIDAVQKRFETDEEVKERVAQAMTRIEEIRQQELLELERLKKKYEQTI